MKRKLRPAISIGLLLLVIAIGIYYLLKHRSLLKQLAHISPFVTIQVMALYLVLFGVLVLILDATLAICKIKIKGKDNALLNAHTLLINFFIPGQGGPAYRGVYLNRRYQLKPRNYIGATLLYFALYAVVNCFLMFVDSRPWWQTTLLVLLAALGCIALVGTYSRRTGLNKRSFDFTLSKIVFLLVVTCLQAGVQAAIYLAELHSVHSHVTLGQVITYTGAANLTLFVALTPGAIGIRESLLIFTQHLHHVPSTSVILANIVDRSVYLVFLLLLIVATVVIQVHGKLQLKKLPALLKGVFQNPS